ncbi:MAG: TIGR04222 domain-containing membrane protein [Cyanobacteriota bacterium]|nr:TIGR04222 domain-containing membrane protein [Cyanobacteriota bacterium]
MRLVILLLTQTINPLELDTVIFCAFYLPIAITCALFAFTLRWWWWKQHSNNLKTEISSISLNEYEIAYLADGISRVIDMVFINLIRRGYLFICPNTGKKEIRKKLPNQIHLLEKAVYSQYSNISVNSDITEQAINEIQHNLQKFGLIFGETQPKLVIRWLSTFPLFVMVALGFFKTVVDVLENQLFGLIGIIWGVVTVVACFFLSKPHRTKYGDNYLNQLQQRHAKLKQIEILNNLSSTRTKEFINLSTNKKSEQLALAFALFGKEVLVAKPFKVVESYFNPPDYETDEEGIFQFHHRKKSE